MRSFLPDGRYTASEHLQVFTLDAARVLVAHGLRLRRVTLDPALYASLSCFQRGALDIAAFRETSGLDAQVALDTMKYFHWNGFIVHEGEDEAAGLREELAGTAAVASKSELKLTPSAYRTAQTLSQDSRVRKPGFRNVELKQLDVLILGGCLAQFAVDPFEAIAPSYGFMSTVRTSGPLDTGMIDRHKPGLVVFQPALGTFLSPLWDQSAFIDDAERRTRLDVFKNFLSFTISQLRSRSAGRLIICQGLTPPQMPPHGRADFRLQLGFSAIVHEINQHIRSLVADEANMFFLDEERVLSNYGKSRLMDDMVATYSHYGLLDVATGVGAEQLASRKDSFDLAESHKAAHLLAQEYLDCYITFCGIGRIKCVVVDLDNTLWPGLAGENDLFREGIPAYKRYNTFQMGVYGGIHQALKILKSRGVLLATSSKNDYDVVMKYWNEILRVTADIPFMLKPDDFVLHNINWELKSKSVREIADALNIGLDSILFVDDNPVERAEVEAALPEVRTLGEDINHVRFALLTDPCLQSNTFTSEAVARTDMMKAQIRREQERRAAPDEGAFLRSLGIEMKIVRGFSNQELDRVVELLQRTNQFNTTQIRYDAAALRALVGTPGGQVWSLSVRDKFTDYGLVGVCVVKDHVIDNFVMSCRVIALQVAVPFLHEVMRLGDLCRGEVRARLVRTNRNTPCHSLFAEAGFSTAGDDLFTRQAAALTPADPQVYRVEHLTATGGATASE